MPWDKVDIEVLLVELEFAGKVFQLILISYDKLFNILVYLALKYLCLSITLFESLIFKALCFRCFRDQGETFTCLCLTKGSTMSGRCLRTTSSSGET